MPVTLARTNQGARTNQSAPTNQSQALVGGSRPARRRGWAIAALAVCASASAGDGFGQAASLETLGASFGFDEQELRTKPVLFAADDVQFDQNNNFISAKGNVEIDQAGRTVRADELYYDAKNQELMARGNVVMFDQKGNKLTADKIALDTDFSRGLLQSVRMKLAPNVRVAATYAERRNEDELSIHRAVLSPCPLCEDKPDRAPLWQIKADQIELDGANGNVYYKDARFELFGVPVFYSPFLMHADPRLDRKSGFLTPTLEASSDFGYGVTGRYFWDITDSTDATVAFTPYLGAAVSDWNNANGGDNGLGGARADLQLRQAIPRGLITVDNYLLVENPGSYLDVNLLNPGDEVINAASVVQFDWGATKNIRVSAKGHLWTNRLLLDALDVDDSSVINDTVRVEGFWGRNYAEIYGETNRAVASPAIEDQFPLFGKASFDYVSEPFLGAMTARVNTDARAIYRDDGRDYNRLSTQAWLEAPFTLPGGQRLTFRAGGVGAVYDVDGTDTAAVTTTTPASPNFSGTAARFQPGVAVDWSLPLARANGDYNQLIEPMVGFSWGGEDDNTGEIPNEDSVQLELDETNLFDPFRTSGIDFSDAGARVNYGIRYQLEHKGNKALKLFVGQSYSLTEDSGLLAASRPNGGGVEEQLSHVIGGIELDAGPITASWTTRYDIEDSTFYRNDIDLGLTAGPLSLAGGYSQYQANDAATRTERVTLSGSLKVLENWKLSAGYSADLHRANVESYSGGVMYDFDCLVLEFTGKRTYDANRDLTDTYGFTVGIPFFSTSGGLSTQ